MSFNTWSVTSKLNDKFLAELDENKFLLQDSALKGLCSIDSYPDTNFLVKKDVKNINKFEEHLFSKPHRSIKKFNKIISAASVINFRNYKYLEKKIKNNSKILEIGAGVGYLAALITFFKKLDTYYICDLSSTLKIIYKFIKSNFPEMDINYYNDQNFYNKKKQGIILINNYEIEKLKEKFDLIINIDSFGEMDKHIVDSYFDYAHKSLKKEGIFFVSNTHGHSNTAYKSPLNYPINRYFTIKKNFISCPTARENPAKYLTLELSHKKKSKKNNINLISKNYFSQKLLKNSKIINPNQNLFYKSFKKIEKCIHKNNKFKLISSDFSINIKNLYFSKLFKLKIENFKIIKDPNIYMLYYFYNKNIFHKVENKIFHLFYKNKDFLNKIKAFYILGKENKIKNKEINYLFNNSNNNTYKKYFLLVLLYLGKFAEFKFFYKKSRLSKNLYFELINFFNYKNMKTNSLFCSYFRKDMKKIDVKKIDDIVLALKLKKISTKKMKKLMLLYHNNYYSIGFLLKKTLFILDEKTKLFFIKKSMSLRKNNLQNTNFIFEILYFSGMFAEAKKIFLKHNLKKYFFYSNLKYFIIKNSLIYDINKNLIFDESSLIINNGTTTFIPFFNTGNNNIVISNNENET
jgi:putative sugar O-methyltransferase